ncbi:MAG: ribonuclease III [Gammaproteobacteria bacterium]|nr:ribonuclease III [Gammaproteobacteria bacterium]
MKPILRFYNYYLSSDRDLARLLKPIIGFTPARMSLFKRAFYHKSMNSNPSNIDFNNERLEFLGDAVLSSIVAEYLFKKYPNKDEGFLTKLRSRIVKRKTMNDIAEKMGLDMILSEYSTGRMSKTMLGNALEALVGAVYLEFGYQKTCRYVVKNVLMRYLDIHKLEKHDDNFKSQLLEWCQKNNKSIKYKLRQKYKQENRDRFSVAVIIDGAEMAVSDDFNKKSAEQAASKLTLAKLADLIEEPSN